MTAVATTSYVPFINPFVAFDCHGYLRPDDNFQSDLQQLEDENAVLLVHCVTIDCYQHFKSV